MYVWVEEREKERWREHQVWVKELKSCIMYIMYGYYVWDEEHQVTIEEERWVAYYVRVEGLKSCIRNYFLFNLFMIIKYNNKNNKIKKNKYK